MEVKNVMTMDVVACGPDTPISEIISMMEKHKIHQIPVIGIGDKLHEKGDVLGMVTLNKITTSDIDPAKTKAKAFMQPCPSVTPDENLKRTARLILDSNMRAIPVVDGELSGIVCEQDIMKRIEMKGLAADFAKKCFCVSSKDPVSKVKQLMLKNNVSRVAVIDNGELSGVAGSLDLISLMRGWQNFPARSSAHTVAYKDKRQIDSTPAKNFCHRAQLIDNESPVAAAIKALQVNEEVLIKRDEEFYIITPKDLLRHYVMDDSVQMVQIAGTDDEDSPYDVSKMRESAEDMMKSWAKRARLQMMKIHIKKHKSQGEKMRYSVHIELPTSLGLIIATKEHKMPMKTYGDLLSAFQHELGDIEKQLKKHIEKDRKPEKMWKARRQMKMGF